MEDMAEIVSGSAKQSLLGSMVCERCGKPVVPLPTLKNTHEEIVDIYTYRGKLTCDDCLMKIRGVNGHGV